MTNYKLRIKRALKKNILLDQTELSQVCGIKLQTLRNKTTLIKLIDSIKQKRAFRGLIAGRNCDKLFRDNYIDSGSKKRNTLLKIKIACDAVEMEPVNECRIYDVIAYIQEKWGISENSVRNNREGCDYIKEKRKFLMKKNPDKFSTISKIKALGEYSKPRRTDTDGAVKSKQMLRYEKIKADPALLRKHRRQCKESQKRTRDKRVKDNPLEVRALESMKSKYKYSSKKELTDRIDTLEVLLINTLKLAVK